MGTIRYILGGVDQPFSIKVCENAVHARKAHFHAELSFALVEQGSGTVEICGQRYSVTAPLVLLIPAGSVHDCHPHDPSWWRFRMAYIDLNWLETTAGLRREQIGFAFMPLNAAHHAAVRHLFDALEGKGLNPGPALFREIALLARAGKTCPGPDAPMPAKPYAPLSLVKQELEGNFLRHLCLNDVCARAGATKCHVIRQFKRRYGLPPRQYAINLRINFAKRLIASGWSLADAALESGFYDQSHFTRFFRDYTGVTPCRYRAATGKIFSEN